MGPPSTLHNNPDARWSLDRISAFHACESDIQICPVGLRFVAVKKTHVRTRTSGIENPVLRTGFRTGKKLIFFSRREESFSGDHGRQASGSGFRPSIGIRTLRLCADSTAARVRNRSRGHRQDQRRKGEASGNSTRCWPRPTVASLMLCWCGPPTVSLAGCGIIFWKCSTPLTISVSSSCHCART